MDDEALVQSVAEAIHEADDKWREDITWPHAVYLARAALAAPALRELLQRANA